VKVWTILLALAVAVAQPPAAVSPATAKVVTGEVTAVDASAKHFKVKGDDGTNYTIALQDNTIYLRLPLGETDQKKATKIALADVVVGDRLLTRGPLSEETKTLPAKTVIIMTKADVAKKQQQDGADWAKRGIAGTVTAVNPDNKEITINTHGRDAKLVVLEASAAGFRRYAADSVRFADTKPGSFGDLQVGDTVRALGNKNEDGSRVKAEELVSGSFLTIAATVVSVNAATGEVVVTDLKTKKQVTIHTNQNSMLRRLEELTARNLARQLRPADAAGGGPPGGPAGSGMRPTADARAPGAGGSGGAGAGGPAGGGAGGMRGGFGGRGGGSDLQQILDHSPQLNLAELKKGDALIISSSKGADSSSITAISLVAGVEPFLAAAPRTAGQVDLGSWSLGAGPPEQ
jgi:hypothetical protein